MDDPIVSVDHIKRMARRDVDEGKSPLDCPFNPMSAAAQTWIEEYQRYSNELSSFSKAKRLLSQPRIVPAAESRPLSSLNGEAE